ncbi:hypothetical protein MKZ38_006972 [Zalerion maritima]|uniref:Uncharacterized protein n=1 Tax=Zalerion maritima TaxID=339359 RepID=A0AAD5RIZ3_9PEZI|nr:hypothetical protein MKZ38_006972 [Zalerion maritima]
MDEIQTYKARPGPDTKIHKNLSQAPPSTTTRKRQINNNDSEPQPKRARLTQKNLAHFNKMGKKESKKSTTASSSTGNSKTSKSTSSTSSGFADKAYRNGILPIPHSKPPTNLEEIQEQHTRTRTTVSPSKTNYQYYTNRVEKAGNESTMVSATSGELLKKYNDEGYLSSFNRLFSGLPDYVGFNNELSAPQPDFVEGLEQREFNPVPVDEQIEGAVLYKDEPHAITLPHIAGEWKGPHGNMGEARLQSSYAGAALVHTRNQALAHMGTSDPPGHAAVTTFATNGTDINFFAHFAAPLEGDPDKLEYHQYQYATANVKDTYQGHRDGRRGIRNAQDRAREQSYALKDQLKEHWKQQRDALRSITEETPVSASDAYPPVTTTESIATTMDPLSTTDAEPSFTTIKSSAITTEPPTYTYEETTPNGTEAQPAPYEDEGGSTLEQPYPPPPTEPPRLHKKSHSRSSHAFSSKRKSSSSRSSHGSSKHTRSRHISKHQNYWTLDSELGRYFHKHSNGSTSWLIESDDEEE